MGFDDFYNDMLRITNQPTLTKDFSIADNVDSLGRAEIIVTAEEMFSIELTNGEIMGIKTYGDLEALIKAKVSA